MYVPASEAESQDLRNIEALVLDPEELIMELEAWNVVKEPPPEHTMGMWNLPSCWPLDRLQLG